MVGEIKHELGMFKSNNNEDNNNNNNTSGASGKEEDVDLFVSGMTLDTYMSNVVMKGPIPEVCGIGNSTGMAFTPPKKQKQHDKNKSPNIATKKSQQQTKKKDNNVNNEGSQSIPQFVVGMSLESYMVQGAKRNKQKSASIDTKLSNNNVDMSKVEKKQQIINVVACIVSYHWNFKTFTFLIYHLYHTHTSFLRIMISYKKIHMFKVPNLRCYNKWRFTWIFFFILCFQ